MCPNQNDFDLFFFTSMLSKAAKNELNTEFWTSFRIYMSKHHSLGVSNSNWVNYKTGFREIVVKTQVFPKEAHFMIQIHSSDPDIRALIFEQWLELKKMYETNPDLELEWEAEYYTEQKEIACIMSCLKGISYVDKANWRALFQFLESHLIHFDEFWSDWKFKFEDLLR